MIGLQHYRADFCLIHVCELQLPIFTHTVATVSQLACLANFTKTLGFILEKRAMWCCRYHSFPYNIIPVLFVLFLDCTWPKNLERRLTAYTYPYLCLGRSLIGFLFYGKCYSNNVHVFSLCIDDFR